MKKYTWRKIMSIAMATVLMVSFSACGKSASSSAQAPASSGEAVSTAQDELKPTNALVLYTSGSTSEYELVVAEFNKAYPDITVETISAGTGELISKIVAEGENPQGDVMMGGGYSALSAIADHLDSYESPNLDTMYEEFRPTVDYITPCYINANSIIVNNALCKELGATVDGWESLTDPVLKGRIAFADPSASSSALEQLVNMLDAMTTSDSPDDGWDFVTEFLTNLDGKLASSSSSCYKGVVEGEYAVGLTNEDKAVTYLKEGADVSVIYPKEGICLRTNSLSIVKGGPNAYNARLFIDFVTSKECQTVMESELNTRPMRTDVPITTEGRIATEKLVSLPYPTDWVSANSDSIKTKFQDLLTSM